MGETPGEAHCSSVAVWVAQEAHSALLRESCRFLSRQAFSLGLGAKYLLSERALVQHIMHQLLMERELGWAGIVMMDFVCLEGQGSGPEQRPPAQPGL